MTRWIVPTLAQFSQSCELPLPDALEVGPDGMLRTPGSASPLLDDLMRPGSVQAPGLAITMTKAQPDQREPDVIRTARMHAASWAKSLETKIVTLVPDPDVIRARRNDRSRADR
jgi:hypothetical protein